MTQREQALRTRVAFVAQPEPRIERHLLVAAAAGVDLVGEPRRPAPSACG